MTLLDHMQKTQCDTVPSEKIDLNAKDRQLRESDASWSIIIVLLDATIAKHGNELHR